MVSRNSQRELGDAPSLESAMMGKSIRDMESYGCGRVVWMRSYMAFSLFIRVGTYGRSKREQCNSRAVVLVVVGGVTGRIRPRTTTPASDVIPHSLGHSLGAYWRGNNGFVIDLTISPIRCAVVRPSLALILIESAGDAEPIVMISSTMLWNFVTLALSIFAFAYLGCM